MKKQKTLSELIPALKKEKIVAMLAPSFITDFHYPSIISELKQLGFDKVVELTFGAKMINREYHKQIYSSKNLLISSVCPACVKLIKQKFPSLQENLVQVDSPMIATAKICKKIWPNHKTCFISPCHAKKEEAQKSDFINYVIDYQQLHFLLNKNLVPPSNKKEHFDKFYNDYTKIYPLSGGLSKTAHLKRVIKPSEEKIIDGWKEIESFLKKPQKNIKFLDCTFCKGGCIGGPCTSKIPLRKKKKLLVRYLHTARLEKIPCGCEGIIEKAKGINFKI